MSTRGILDTLEEKSHEKGRRQSKIMVVGSWARHFSKLSSWRPPIGMGRRGVKYLVWKDRNEAQEPPSFSIKQRQRNRRDEEIKCL